MKRFYARTTAFFLILVAVCLGIAPVYAGGQAEADLASVDKLIGEKRYDDAILVLADFMKKNPNYFDQAQKKMQRIIRVRETYNNEASNLLDTIVKEPTADAKKLAMIKQLESLEKNPNKTAQAFISKTKETALFTYNRAQFDKIMQTARVAIDAGKFSDAVTTYQTGYVLYKPEFDESSYGDIITNSVNDAVRTVESTSEDYTAQQTILEDAVAELRAAYDSGDTARIDAAYPPAERALLDTARRRAAVQQSGKVLENTFAVLTTNDATLTDSSFLPFAFRFTLGRKTETQKEGILGAIDTQWTLAVAGLEKGIGTSSLAAYRQLEDLAAAGDWTGIKGSSVTAAKLSDYAIRTAGLWSAVVVPEASRGYAAFQPQAETPHLSVIYLNQRLEGNAGLYSSLADLGLRGATAESAVSAYTASFSPEPSALPGALFYFRQKRTENLALQNDIRSFSALVGKVDVSYKARTNGVYTAPEAVDADAKLQATADALLDRVRTNEVGIVATAASLEYQDSLASYRQLESKENQGLSLLEGQPSTDPQLNKLIVKYPAEAIAILDPLQPQLKSEQMKIAAVISRYSAEESRFLESPALASTLDSGKKLSDQYTALNASLTDTLGKARDQKLLADSARLEADRRLLEAKTALAQENFDLARDRIGKAREKYNQSLSLAENSSLRAESDRNLLALGADVTKAENEKVIKDVRALITKGRNFYFLGNFDQAEQSLVQAQTRWKATNLSDEPEVAYWLSITRAALSIKTGRDIPSTAPLYPEMSQLLSLARQYYDEGRKLLDARRKNDALAMFNSAKEKIQQLKVMFPLNQEASVLALRIDQIIDPDAFQLQFRQKLTEARAKLATQPQTGYSDIADLYTINPNYPGLKAIYEQAQITLGLRLPPTDPKKIADSDNLYRAALKIVQANTRSQFPVALEQLNMAIQLNPNNDQAISLKDRIQTDVGGQVAAVLSSYAEEQYQRAVQEFQNGNIITASAIVDQLLQDPKNQRSTKIVELQKRIQSRL